MTDAAVEQQKDIGKAFREIADLRGDFKELRVAIVGIDSNNGLRGEIREFMAQFGGRMTDQDTVLRQISDAQVETDHWKRESQARFETYLQYEREATCHGKEALDKYVEKIEVEKVDIRKQNIILIGTIISALLASGAAIASAVLTYGAAVASTLPK